MNRSEQKQSNREKHPEMAAIIDELRAKFPGAKVMWAKDMATGVEFGKRDSDPDKTFQIPEGYFPSTPVTIETEKKDGRKNRSKTR